ncbi:MAG: DUF1194 domain-containing protein [Pseudomonadota bacterium]
MRRCLVIAPFLAALAVFGLAGGEAAAHGGARVDVELVLLADASNSIDAAEIAFQRQGYAEAITDPSVIEAIAAGRRQRIAVAYVEWGEVGSQDLVTNWRVIDGRAAAEAFAAELLSAPRKAYGRNAIGAALLFGKDQILTNAFKGDRRVIDFSADSANNWGGPDISTARAAVLDAEIEINGLAVLCRACSGRPVSYDLEAAFEEQIIGGPGAFVVTADGPESFFDAVRRKMVLEIAGDAPPERLAETRAPPASQ